MNFHPQPRSRLHGFTLVELLTVIAIIAILMGLLFPVLGIIKDKAHNAAAKTACLGIITAVKAYNTEYGKYPEPRATASSTPADAIVGESTLSFFALGPQPGSNSTSLGKLIELSREGARQGNWWLVAFPCGALVLLAICINFIGDGLRDAVDSKLDTGV